jgi:hypothetical protein
MAKGDNKENNRQKANIGTKRTETGEHQEKNTKNKNK